MERSDSLIRLVAVLVFVAIMAYLGVSFISSWRDPLRTVKAVGMETHDGVETAGFIVRDEEVLTASGADLAVTATEGARLSKGETVAVRYSGTAAMERAQRISEIQLRIRQLTAVMNGKTDDELSGSAVQSLSRLVLSEDLSKLYSVARDVDAYIISGSALSSGNEAAEIARLEAELHDLAQSAESDTRRLTAPFAGTFSFSVDGFESVNPEALEGLTPSGFRDLFADPREPETDAVGRLVKGIRWYYVTVMDEKSALRLTPGKSVDTRFSRTYASQVSMRVESVSQPEEGECCVVLSSDRYLQDTAALREATAEIVFGTLSGVSVPREALHLNDKGETVVYILEGVRAQEIPVTVLTETADLYMVKETRDGLRVNDQVIVRAASLYDGAVVER